MLEDGTYDAVVVDAEEGPAPHSTRVELAIAAGPHKGELVAIVTDLTLIASRSAGPVGPTRHHHRRGRDPLAHHRRLTATRDTADSSPTRSAFQRLQAQ